MSAARTSNVRRLVHGAVGSVLLASLLPSMGGPAAGAAQPAAVPPAPVAPALAAQATPASSPASDVRQPTVGEIPITGIDGALLAQAPQPPSHDGGHLSALSTAPRLRPAIAAEVRLPEERAASLIAVAADAGFPEGAVIQVRVEDESGWSAWTELHVDPEHGPDPGSAEAAGARVGSDPLLSVRARIIQVRIDTPTGEAPTGTRVVAVTAPVAASDDRSGQLTTLASTGQPRIITRAQWGADESWRSREPYYTDDVRSGFVHHTASTSNYSEAQAASQVRAIYAYHTKSLGHSDIDYNFLVDRFGRLYEGRYGGMDRPVLGAHTAGFNEHTFAVVALGNFDTFSPPAAEMAAIKDAIARLFAWKLSLVGARPDATVQLVSAGFIRATKYPKGSVATLPAISSHQMVNYTACPGRYLQAQLDSIRTLAASYSQVVLSVPSPAIGTVVAGSVDSVELTSKADRAVDWRADILSPCSDAPVRTLTGSTEAAGDVRIRWDLRDASGSPVLPATYTVRLSGTAADLTPVVEVSADITIAPARGGAWGPCANVSRVVGDDLATTSVLWGRVHAADSPVVVVTGDADTLLARSAAMVAAPLARSLRAPLLLNPQDVLSRVVAGEIVARAPGEVIVVGDERVVSRFVESSLELLGVRVTRLAGSTRVRTAIAVAEHMDTSAGAVLVSPNGSRAHALAGSALAASRKVPLLLASGSKISRLTAQALAGRDSVTVASSTVLSDTVIRAAMGTVPWDRLSATDAVGASLAVAGAFERPRRFGLLPESYSQWLTGPLAASAALPLLLTPSLSLHPDLVAYLSGQGRLRGILTTVDADGVDDEVLGQASRLLTGEPWAVPGVGLPRLVRKYTAVREVQRADASPEPIAAGGKLVVRSRVLAKWTDGTWHPVRRGEPFVVKFRPKGGKYRTEAEGTTRRGRARAVVTASRSGHWRIVLGGERSRRDWVRVW